jgi:aldehyde dehydrogenase (NAD+)
VVGSSAEWREGQVGVVTSRERSGQLEYGDQFGTAIWVVDGTDEVWFVAETGRTHNAVDGVGRRADPPLLVGRKCAVRRCRSSGQGAQRQSPTVANPCDHANTLASVVSNSIPSPVATPVPRGVRTAAGMARVAACVTVPAAHPTIVLASTAELSALAARALAACAASTPAGLATRSPIIGAALDLPGARSAGQTADPVDTVVERSATAFAAWRVTPAPVRGELIRVFGSLLRAHKADLARLVQVEVGKIESEAMGEVQEMIDICDFAVGLSRQLHGLTITSERPGHRLMEQWHPIGPVAVITAFNFPVAVWSWNAALAIVCGNPVIWKPSELTPLTALATSALFDRAAAAVGAPVGLNQVLLGDSTVGAELVADARVPLISATGSTRMGAQVAPVVAARFGRALLELGGNNAAIVSPSADLDLAVRGITFAAAGTAGQRCTTLRRLIVHRRLHGQLLERLVRAYESLPVGNPFDASTLVGPLIHAPALRAMDEAIVTAVADGGALRVGGERVLADSAPDAAYVRPAIVEMPAQTTIVQRETFAPLLYVLTYDDFDEAVALNNSVPQGLASSVFTTDMREAERFMSANGSDCGIANVNIGPSGAEIGGAFGGEKATGGGRESGSDSWRAYMRRTTNTINYSDTLPLAQGVTFGSN